MTPGVRTGAGRPCLHSAQPGSESGRSSSHAPLPVGGNCPGPRRHFGERPGAAERRRRSQNGEGLTALVSWATWRRDAVQSRGPAIRLAACPQPPVLRVLLGCPRWEGYATRVCRPPARCLTYMQLCLHSARACIGSRHVGGLHDEAGWAHQIPIVLVFSRPQRARCTCRAVVSVRKLDHPWLGLRGGVRCGCERSQTATPQHGGARLQQLRGGRAQLGPWAARPAPAAERWWPAAPTKKQKSNPARSASNDEPSWGPRAALWPC